GIKNVVLVHGGVIDGAGLGGGFKVLKKEGVHVSVVPKTTNHTAEAAAPPPPPPPPLPAMNGPSILVGHSYGGVVITESGNLPNVAGLVYIAAFAPDKGESVASLLKEPPPGPA